MSDTKSVYRRKIVQYEGILDQYDFTEELNQLHGRKIHEIADVLSKNSTEVKAALEYLPEWELMLYFQHKYPQFSWETLPTNFCMDETYILE